MNKYIAYGLNIESELELPNLITAPFNAQNSGTDVYIKQGDISKAGLTDAKLVKPNSQANQHQLWLDVPNTGRFLIENGTNITVESHLTADILSIQTHLLSSCIGAIIHQRNELIFNGCAVVKDGVAMLFLGNSGEGKSVLAAHAVKRKMQVLSDDLIRIDSNRLAQPGPPFIKLWKDSIAKLELENTNHLKQVRPQIEKYIFPLNEALYSQPIEVKYIFLLSSHNKGTFEFEELSGLEKFQPLKNHMYLQHLVNIVDNRTGNLKQLAQLSNQVRLQRLIYPNQGFHINEVLDRIQLQFEAEDCH